MISLSWISLINNLSCFTQTQNLTLHHFHLSFLKQSNNEPIPNPQKQSSTSWLQYLPNSYIYSQHFDVSPHSWHSSIQPSTKENFGNFPDSQDLPITWSTFNQHCDYTDLNYSWLPTITSDKLITDPETFWNSVTFMTPYSLPMKRIVFYSRNILIQIIHDSIPTMTTHTM